MTEPEIQMPHGRWRFDTICLEYLGHTQVDSSVLAKYLYPAIAPLFLLP